MPTCQYQYKSRTVGSSGNQTTWPQCNELTSGKFCIFHDKEQHTKNEQEVIERFEKKVRESISNNEPLNCIGYYLPAIDFIKLLDDKTFAQPVIFIGATFYQGVNFSGVTFSKPVFFSEATFSGEITNFSGVTFSVGANFSVAKFLDTTRFENSRFKVETEFNKVLFEQPMKVTFDNSDLSKVSFADSDITRIIFGHKITWGGERGFTIIEEEWLESKAKGKNKSEYTDVSLGLVLSVYRNLRESYEFRLRYDEAGEFFIREMELKRKYREIKSENSPTQIRENGPIHRNLLSLNGLYYRLSDYGESIWKPTFTGVMILSLSTFFFSMQSNLTLEPALPYFPSDNSTTSTFVGFERATNVNGVKGMQGDTLDTEVCNLTKNVVSNPPDHALVVTGVAFTID